MSHGRGWRSVVRLGIVTVFVLSGCWMRAQAAAKDLPAALSNVITVNPPTTVRGSSFEVNVQNAPPGASKVIVELDGRPVPSQVPDAKFPGIVRASVPDSVDPGSPDFVPLGSHHVSVMFDGRWFTGGTTLTVVRPEQTSPVLRDVMPLEIGARQAKRRIVLTGSGFLTTPPNDNQIVLGGLPLAVVWDGCDHPENWAKDKGSMTHGRVDPSGSSITLCNFPVVQGVAPEIGVRQGNAESALLTVHVPPWSKAAIVIASVCVNLISAALVILLASFVRRYRIGNSHYGMFRILFLDPETNTYSLSKYQFYMWTGAAVFTYAYLAISRIFVQELSLPDIPSTLPGIIGIGAGTAIGSQIVTGIRGPKGGGQEKPSLGDFVTSGGVAAADRVQMFVWTTLGVVGFCLATLRAAPWEITSLPQVGTGLMYLMGLSSLGYLGGKLARKPGPVLSEISVNTTRADDGVRSGFATGVATPDLSQPTAAAEAVLRQAQATVSGMGTTSSSVAFSAAQQAISALRGSIAAAASADKSALDVMAQSAVTADAAARAAADEFSRAAGAMGDDSEGGRLAEVAQECAAAAQELASGSAQAAGVAQAAVANVVAAGPGLRTISVRGRNLSRDATFEINDMELPFRMLVPVDGVRGPRMVAPEDDSSLANMARELRLTIAPETLGAADRASYDAWFSKSVTTLRFSITNPDGQRSEISFSVPPGAGQANG